MKKIKLTNKFNGKVLTVHAPEHIWFNTSWNIRGKLSDTKQMTASQFLTTSNSTLVDMFNEMTNSELVKFKKFILEFVDSNRCNDVVNIIEIGNFRNKGR